MLAVLGLRPPSIRGGGLVIVHNEETVLPEEAAPSRIMKQGTFTVDRPHQSNMVPIIFPDSDVSRNPNTVSGCDFLSVSLVLFLTLVYPGRFLL